MRITKQNYKFGNEIAKAINKLNEPVTVKLEKNKDQMIQSLRNKISLLQNRVGKIASQVRLLEDGLITNEIKINNADQCINRTNIVMHSIPLSV